MLVGSVTNATKISLAIQSITGVIGFYGLSLPIDPKDLVLKQVLGLEMLVQVIEFIFYLGFLNVPSIYSLTQKRYHDWFLSTPVMLFTTALYFYYVNTVEQFDNDNNKSKKFNIYTFIKSNFRTIILFIFLNFLMLLFGYLAELGYLDRGLAFVFGSLALGGSFGVIYEKFAKFSEKTRRFFWIMFSIWLLYGFAFLLPSIPKNIGYTILDIFAKNFFGVFLAYTLSTKSI